MAIQERDDLTNAKLKARMLLHTDAKHNNTNIMRTKRVRVCKRRTESGDRGSRSVERCRLTAGECIVFAGASHFVLFTLVGGRRDCRARHRVEIWRQTAIET